MTGGTSLFQGWICTYSIHWGIRDVCIPRVTYLVCSGANINLLLYICTFIIICPIAEKSFYEEVWFIAVAAAVGVLLISFVMVVVTVICFKCCCKCGSDNGKIYCKKISFFNFHVPS